MKLNKFEREKAKKELSAVLQMNGGWMRTSELQGTRLFHGTRTLSLRQIAVVLREIPGIVHRYCGRGCKAPSCWKLSAEVSLEKN